MEGERIIGSSPTEFTLVDYPTMDDRSAMNLKSSDRLKQEVDNEQRYNFVQVSIDCNVLLNPTSDDVG